MDKITRVGVDLAKRVIQVHAVDACERVVAAKAFDAHHVSIAPYAAAAA